MTSGEWVSIRVGQMVAEAPPLTAEAIERLRQLLPPVPGERDLGCEPERAA
jgi:hypothetical protein